MGAGGDAVLYGCRIAPYRLDYTIRVFYLILPL